MPVRIVHGRPVLAKMPAERLKTLAWVEHGVHAEAVTAVKAGVGPLVVGGVLVLREPADAAGVGLVMGPGVAAKAGEVLVEAAAVGDVEPAALEETVRLHLANETVAPDRAARCNRTAGVGALMSTERNSCDAARGIDADDAGGLLAQLALDGEAVLNLIGNAWRWARARARLGGCSVTCCAVGDGHAACGRQVAGSSEI